MRILDFSYMAPTELKPHPQNPRIHPDSAIEKLAQTIDGIGFVNPIITTEDGIILAGHSRQKAALQLGLESVPVLRTDLKGPEALAYLVADNKTSELSGWDLTGLKDILSELDTGEFDVSALTAFGEDEIEDLMTQFYVEDPEPEPEPEEEGPQLGKTDGIDYEEKYGVIVMCEDENDQQRIYDELVERGYTCKVVAV